MFKGSWPWYLDLESKLPTAWLSCLSLYLTIYMKVRYRILQEIMYSFNKSLEKLSLNFVHDFCIHPRSISFFPQAHSGSRSKCTVLSLEYIFWSKLSVMFGELEVFLWMINYKWNLMHKAIFRKFQVTNELVYLAKWHHAAGFNREVCKFMITTVCLHQRKSTTGYNIM